MADQDFEQLLKVVEQLNQQLSELTSKATAAKNALTTGGGVADPTSRAFSGQVGQNFSQSIREKSNQLESAIADVLRAIRQGRIRGGIAESAKTDELARRIPGSTLTFGPGPVREGLEAGNIRGKIDNEVRKFARGVAERFQQSLIQGAIEARNAQVNRQQNVLLGDELVRRQQPEYKVKQMLDREVARFQAEMKAAMENPTVGPRPTPGGVLGRITPETRNEANAQKYVDLAVNIGLVEQKIKELERTEYKEKSGAAAAVQNQINLYRQLQVELDNLAQDMAKAASLNSAATFIPGGAKGAETDINAAWRNAFRLPPDLSGEIPKIKKIPDSALTQLGFGDFNGDIGEQEKAAAGLKTNISTLQWSQNRARMGTAVSKAAQLEEERLKLIQEEVVTEKKYAQALKQAQALGFGAGNLQRIETRGTAGIERLRFQRVDDEGRQRVFDTFVNPNGKATPGISNQFRTFGQGVVRDIGEFTKWSIALAAVYTPMRKLGELIQEMIANQAKLAEATTTVSSAFIDQSKIFDIAAESADGVGEAVSGVIDAFTSAYRAAGGGSDQVERLVTAQKLLNDSLTLSKLSTLDQAGAIDTLSAALRQSGDSLSGVNDPLQKGSQLLDKWVRVTKVANVDLATLATGFAVLGDAAEAAGIDVDQLNGLIAAIAETGISAGREAANTARAIVSGFQSDQARQQLESLGVAVEDSTGKMRPFLDIMQELYNLKKSGVIDPTQFSALTLALGGGTRRQAAYSTFIENFNRVSEIAQQSAQANGDAQAALAKQLETVQTAMTKLGNAFSSLAQTMGTEGGFLTIIKDSVNAGTALVHVFDQLIGLLGKATPAMAAFVAATLVAKQKGLPGVQQLVGTLSTYTNPQLIDANGQIVLPGIGKQLTPNEKLGNFASQNLFGTNAVSGAFQGALLSALPAILNATNKSDRYGGTKAVADVVGGVGGGIVGAMVAGSPLIGAAIGTAISEAFINSTIARKTDIFGYFGQAKLAEPGISAKTGEKTPDERLIEAEANLYKSIGGGNEALGKILTTPGQKGQNITDLLNKAIADRDEERFKEVAKTYGTFFNRSLGLNQADLQNAFQNNQQVIYNQQVLAYRRASPQAQQAYDTARTAATIAGGGGGEATAFSRLVDDNKKLYGDLLSELKASSKQTLGQQRLSGDIKGADYTRRIGAVQAFDVKSLQYYTQFGEEFIKIDKNVNNATDAFNAFNEVILSGTADTVPEITSLGSEIEKLINILGDASQQTPDALKALGFDNLEQVKTQLKDLQETAATLFEDVYKQAKLSGLSIPQISGDISKPLTTPENQLVAERTKKLQDSFYQGFLKLPDDTYQALKDSFDEFAVTIKDSGDEFYTKVTETDEQFRQAAIQQLQEEGKIRSQKESQFGIQQVDLPGSKLGELQNLTGYFGNYLTKFFPQYKQNPEDIGVIFNDYITGTLHGDNLAIKLALEKLVDINQKQLDGMYNIPEGATFWVPLQAAYYRPKNEGGGGGLPDVAGQANTQALDANTQALKDMALAFRGDPGYSRQAQQAQSDKNAALGFRGDLGYSRQAEWNKANLHTPGGLANPMPRSTEAPSFLQQLMDGLRNFFGGFGQLPTESSRGYHGAGTTYPGIGKDISNATPQPVQAKLDLRFDNSVQLIVDGRVLASVITPYLATDLIKMEASQGTITKRYVI